nr:serine/threonine-protein kinase-like protein At3g51990 [Arachis hypogaea]
MEALQRSGLSFEAGCFPHLKDGGATSVDGRGECSAMNLVVWRCREWFWSDAEVKQAESAVSTSNSLTPSPSFSSSSTATTSKKQNNKEKEKPIKIQHFHYSDLEAATNGFSERKLLGKGSHGYVYKAVMVSSSSFASAPEFIISNNKVDNEIDILSKIQSNNSKLSNWGRRVRLALKTAKEIDTLHSSTPLVIHRDIKSTNVLIDRNFNARLGDQ